MTLQDTQAEVKEWTARNFPKATTNQPFKGIVEELGELAHHDLKMEQGIRVSEDHHAGILDALGDMMIYMLHYCSLRNISLQVALDITWAQVKQRDWIRNTLDGKTDRSQVNNGA